MSSYGTRKALNRLRKQLERRILDAERLEDDARLARLSDKLLRCLEQMHNIEYDVARLEMMKMINCPAPAKELAGDVFEQEYIAEIEAKENLTVETMR